jgi:nucleotide-binding universal stress UspA family protein
MRRPTRVHVLSVVDRATVQLVLDEDSANGGRDRAQLLEAAEDVVDEVADRAMTHLRGRVSTAGQLGEPFREIDDYVQSHDVDVVVMATRGRSGVERYLIGSATEAVVRISDVPVCCVPIPTTDDG